MLRYKAGQPVYSDLLRFNFSATVKHQSPCDGPGQTYSAGQDTYFVGHKIPKPSDKSLASPRPKIQDQDRKPQKSRPARVSGLSSEYCKGYHNVTIRTTTNGQQESKWAEQATSEPWRSHHHPDS